MHGQFSWYDFMTPDAASAKRFYTSVAGWGTQAWDQGDYTMWTAGPEPIGGINPITPEQSAQGVSPHWLAYVTVDDVEGATTKVRALGGKVMHGPETIPDVGRFAIIQDPFGAMMAIIRSDTPSPGFDGTASVGKFTWHELMTTDIDRAFDFYRQLFGWEKIEEMDMGSGMGRYLEYGKNGKMYGGMFNRRPEHGDMAPYWTYYANVKDIGKSVSAAKRGGGTLLMGPMEVPGGSTVAMLKDNQGAMFALHQSAAKSAPSAAAKSASTPRKKAASKAKPRSKAAAKSRPKKKAAKSTARPRAKARPKTRPRAKRAAKKKSRRR